MGSKGGDKDFDYNLIKIFGAVISAGNAAKAAQQLGITPAAVSLALRRLQSHYQEALFVRGKNGLLPTDRAIDLHRDFQQVIELLNGTFLAKNRREEAAQITVMGSDIVESYYLSQLHDIDVFEQVLINHFSSRNIAREQMIERIFTSQCDLVISTEPIARPGIENQLIDSFKSFVCICASSHMLSQLTQLTLHQFYSSRHALFQMNINHSPGINERVLVKNTSYHHGQRMIGYCSDSINGLVSVVERTSLIALMPLKMALFFKNQRKYDIKLVLPPPELMIRPIQVHASWKHNDKNISVINDIVSRLHTLSSFRR